jgi:sugar lactone lactonase YvrE
MSQFFAFALGLLKPRPDTKNNTTPIQRVADNKLLDLNVLRVIHDYLGTSFYFTSQDVAVEHRVIIASGVNGVILHYPLSLCELSDGCIAVAGHDSLIRIFRDNVLVQSINHSVMGRHGLSGICTNSSNQLITTDVDNNQIHVFSRDGSHIRSFGRFGLGDGQLNTPQGVCVDSKGNILTADAGNHCISVFDIEGNFIRKFGKYESGDDQLGGACDICVDGKDHVYVADRRNNRVSKFSSNGTFLRNFGSQCSGPGQLQTPHGVCVTQDGKYIVVTEYEHNRVCVLSGTDGSFVASYGSYGRGDKQFFCASGCTITSDGRILASDMCNNRIHEIRKR